MELNNNKITRKKKLISEKMNNYINGETIYEKAYQHFLSKLLNDNSNKITTKMVPIKLERSVNIIK
jgi:hypothetical protein